MVKGAEHGEGVSSVQCADGTAVHSSVVLDATGHTRQLIQFAEGKKFDPGYQGAYGITAKVGSWSTVPTFKGLAHALSAGLWALSSTRITRAS